jgi:hypothetical protein
MPINLPLPAVFSANRPVGEAGGVSYLRINRVASGALFHLMCRTSVVQPLTPVQ